MNVTVDDASQTNTGTGHAPDETPPDGPTARGSLADMTAMGDALDLLCTLSGTLVSPRGSAASPEASQPAVPLSACNADGWVDVGTPRADGDTIGTDGNSSNGCDPGGDFVHVGAESQQGSGNPGVSSIEESDSRTEPQPDQDSRPDDAGPSPRPEELVDRIEFCKDLIDKATTRIRSEPDASTTAPLVGNMHSTIRSRMF